MNLVRTSNTHKDFIRLTGDLDADLNQRYGARQAGYNAHNRIEPIDTAMIGYIDDLPVACGCFRRIDPETMEIKRMYVVGAHRRKGYSTALLKALERWGAERGCTRAILETGRGQPEAIALYRRAGYHTIENYGPYRGMENSICMQRFIEFYKI